VGQGRPAVRGGHQVQRLGGRICGRGARVPGTERLLEADKAINEAVAKDANNARYLYLQGRVADAIGKAEEANRKYERR